MLSSPSSPYSTGSSQNCYEEPASRVMAFARRCWPCLPEFKYPSTKGLAKCHHCIFLMSALATLSLYVYTCPCIYIYTYTPTYPSVSIGLRRRDRSLGVLHRSATLQAYKHCDPAESCGPSRGSQRRSPAPDCSNMSLPLATKTIFFIGAYYRA